MNNITTKSDDRQWALPPRKGGKLKAGLYLVATPIGNLGDMSLRALDILAAADFVACEDTRVSGKLMNAFGLKKALIKYNDHTSAAQRAGVLDKIKAGGVVALISDAGMPLVSDPGYKLVQACAQDGLYVTSAPGANAPLMALQLSGLPSDQFSFLGFLPPKSAARQKAFSAWKDSPGSLIVFETAPRLLAMLKDVRSILGERNVAVTRELTKMYEQVLRGSVVEVIKALEARGGVKGEIVVVIGPGEPAALSDDDVKTHVKEALKTMSTKEAAAHVAVISGRPRKELYALALEVSKG